MNAVYCFKPVVNQLGEYIHFKPLNNDFFKLAKKSVQSVNKYYNTIFYTDKNTSELFKKNNIHFDKIVILDTLENNQFMNYSLPKIHSMIIQDDPYIMFDFDTIIGEKLESDYDITYAYYEVDLTQPFNHQELMWIQSSYINPFYNNISKYYDFNFNNNVDWRRYPNFSTLMVKDVNIVKNTYNYLLENVPIDVIETTPPTLIEQFILHQNVIMNNITYGTFIKKETNIMDITKEKIYHLNINKINIDEVINIINNFYKD
jgi:hypothetical protein